MADDIDELIIQLESFTGLRALPQTAKEAIEAVVNKRANEKLEKAAREARRLAERYKALAKADAEPVLLIDPQPKRQGRRKKGLSNAQKADYWGEAGQVYLRAIEP